MYFSPIHVVCPCVSHLHPHLLQSVVPAVSGHSVTLGSEDVGSTASVAVSSWPLEELVHIVTSQSTTLASKQSQLDAHSLVHATLKPAGHDEQTHTSSAISPVADESVAKVLASLPPWEHVSMHLPPLYSQS